MKPEHVFVASKRAPFEHERDPRTGEVRLSLAPGGTGSVVADQAGLMQVSWVASAMTDEDRRLAAAHPDGIDVEVTRGNLRVHLVEHDPEMFAAMQYYVTSDVLWATNNLLWDTWRAPTYDDATRTAWDGFLQFSREFAEALARRSEGVENPAFMLHDYQIAGVPPYLRALRPDAPILLFVHIPWPPADVWRTTPRYMRRALVESLLAADTIGFFARRWVRNFLDCVADVMPDVEIDADVSDGVVRRDAGSTSVCALPLGYSPEALAARGRTLPDDVAAWAGDRPLVVHSGRTDPIKNAWRAVVAFGRALDSGELPVEPRLLVRVTPNRLYVSSNREYLDRTEDEIRKLNEARGTDVVRLWSGNDVGLTLGCFERADVVFLNSTIDGQNLSAFESSIVNRRNAPLILSETCGAAEVLGDVARVVSAFDVDEQARALVECLTMPPDRRAAQAARRRAVAERYSLPRWVQWLIDALASARRRPAPAGAGAAR